MRCGGEFQNLKLGTIGDIGTYSFDYAKTMTTGEGGMVVFRNSLGTKACAWHDHGHENNPKKRDGKIQDHQVGLTLGMMEIQGYWSRSTQEIIFCCRIQRSNCEKIWTKLKDLEGVTRRMEHEGSNGTADTLVIELENAVKANEVRHLLQEKGINTKILPEAITWHFAGLWEHIPELNNGENLLRDELMHSEERLRRCVALPTSVKFDDQIPQKIYDCINTRIGKVATVRISNQQTPEVSVLVPAFNQEEYIGRCLRSLLHQTMRQTDYEIVVKNDGSTDLTRYAVSQFSQGSESNIQYIEHKQNTGLPSALNTGIMSARGRFIVRVDSDDFVNQNYLTFLHAYLTLNNKARAVS